MLIASTQAWLESSTYRTMVSAMLVGGGAAEYYDLDCGSGVRPYKSRTTLTCL